MQRGNEIRTVVHGVVRFVVDNGIDVLVVGFVVFALDGKRGDLVVLHQGGGHVVLGAQGIGRAQDNLGTARFERLHQGGGSRGNVQTGCQALAL